jgi:hypothetical protein
MARPAIAGTTRTRSIQFAEQIREITIARLLRRGLEGAAECGCDAGMSGRNVHLNDLAVDAV